MPLRHWIKSANFAIEGILHAAKTQRHLRYHFYAAAFVLIASFALGVTRTELALISLAVIAVLLAEMINTAIELIVDMISPEHSEHARAAKDIAAGGVLVTAVGAAVLGYVILFPHLTRVFARGLEVVGKSKADVAVLSTIIVVICVILLKAYFGKGHPLSGGMPSGHAAISFSIWISVTIVTLSPIASLLCLSLAVAIAQSRISTKVHRPLEVIAGALMGIAVTLILFWLFS